jgi:hypothetical protein
MSMTLEEFRFLSALGSWLLIIAVVGLAGATSQNG